LKEYFKNRIRQIERSVENKPQVLMKYQTLRTTFCNVKEGAGIKENP
jgi:hypothetical protein